VSRIQARFAKLKAEGRSGLAPFITACDPDLETSARILNGLPAAGADLIELGMPFTDPMAEGPSIQVSYLRALKAGATMQKTLDLVRGFRALDNETPITLMGYFNPIHHMGCEAFCKAAAEAGVDGLIVVDLPAGEDSELRVPANRHGIDLIRLAAPTTDDKRLPTVVGGASGFLYYVSITGITGAATPDFGEVETQVTRIRKGTKLPIVVGFGIKTPEHAKAVAKFADAAAVGSALVSEVGAATSGDDAVARVHGLVSRLAAGMRSAR